MQDAQGPTDAEDGAGDAQRRAGLRLRDAEAVATVRRDMFGDGSLIDALAGSPPAPEHAGSPPGPTASAQPATPSAAEGDVGAGHGEAAQQADPAETAGLGGPGPLANVAQSLDAIINSFPAEPVAGTPPRPGEESAEANLAGSPTDASPAPGTAAEASEPAPNARSAIAALQMGVSSLFNSLGSIGSRAGDDVQPVEEPPPPGAPVLDLDMSMLEVRPPAPAALQPAAPPRAAAAPNGASPRSIDPVPQAHEAQVGEAQVDEVQTEAIQAVELDLDMSMLERPPARPVLQPIPERARLMAILPRPRTASCERVESSRARSRRTSGASRSRRSRARSRHRLCQTLSLSILASRLYGMSAAPRRRISPTLSRTRAPCR